MQRHPDPAKPITIGFIACDAYEEVSNKVWQGVSESAEEAGFNLIFFAGGPIHDPIGYRQEGNVVYNLIQPERVDGIILLASSLNFAASRQEMAQFIEKFGKIPIICLEEEFPGLVCILKDDYDGMRIAANHLIVKHQRKQIVFMRGPMGFVGSQKRYQGYLDILTENNLPFDPNLVMPNPASWSYAEAVNNFHSFLEDHALRPRFDFDAVLAGNDENALAAIHVLQSMKVRIPDDVSVVGFDDLALAGSNSPALTTMRPPFLEMGRRAIENSRMHIQWEISQPIGDVTSSSSYPAFLWLPVTHDHRSFLGTNACPDHSPKLIKPGFSHCWHTACNHS